MLGQGSSSAHQSVRNRSTEAAKLLPGYYGVSSSQPPQPWDMLSLLWQDLLLVLMAVGLLQTPPLKRIMALWHARIHGRDKLVKWGPHEWVLDSGAWIHCTSNPLVVGLQFQEIANPHVQPGLELVSVRTERFEFPSVRYVAGDNDDARNVVSVSQLARDHGLVTVFEPTSCHVKDKKTGQIVGKGRLRNGMYMLDYLRVVGQYIGDREAGGGRERGDGEGGGRGHGEQGSNGEGDTGMAEGRGGGRQNRDGTGVRTGASSVSGAAEGDINEEETVNQEEEEKEGSREDGIQEMNDENIDEDDNGKTHQEINGNGDKEEDQKRGGDGSTFGESSGEARKGLFSLSPFVLVLWLCIASLLQCTSRWTGVSLLLILKLPLILNFILSMGIILLVKQIWSRFRGRSTQGTTGDHYVQESPVEHNRRLFGLSRRCDNVHLPSRAFPTSTTNAASRPEDFFVDSGAYYHTTWNESILFHYPRYLQNHTKPPTRSLGGIAAGSIAVARSGYLNGNRIMLDGVLLALEAQANLISVGQLSIYYGVQVEMDEVGVVIKKKQNGVQIGGGKIVGNLYVLEYFLPGGLFAHCPTPQP